MAVNSVNYLPRSRYRPFLCTSRQAGPLGALVAPDVPWLQLERRQRFDMAAFRRLVAFIRDNDIRIIHAHTTSLFIAVLAAGTSRIANVLWHDHGALGQRNEFLYRRAVSYTRAVIVVSQPLLRWITERLRFPKDRACYIPNFAVNRPPAPEPPKLPGRPGRRIVCVANFRPEKNHFNLLEAMSIIHSQEPDAELLLVGECRDSEYFARVKQHAERCPNVTLLGQRLDVADVLRACDIGVISSNSEGLPLALIEYGNARLPVVTTAVGQAADVVDSGRAGLIVEPANPQALAAALLTLLRSPEEKARLGERLHRRVESLYSAESVMRQICGVYDSILGESGSELIS